MNNYGGQLLQQYEMQLRELRLIGCNLQHLIQESIDLSINVADKNIFNRIKNIFLSLNTIFCQISLHDSNKNFLLIICKIRKSIKLIIEELKVWLVYSNILHKIEKFLFVIFRYAYKKKKFIILKKINSAIIHLNSETFLVDSGFVALPSIDMNINIQSLNACFSKLQLFLATEIKHPNYCCDFHDLLTVANLLNTYYICWEILKSYEEYVKLYSFSRMYFIKISFNISVPEKISQYISDNSRLLKLDLIKTNSTIYKYKIKLNRVIRLINLKLNNNLYVKNWGTNGTSYSVEQANIFSKHFIIQIN